MTDEKKPEEKKHRSLDEIRRDYSALCTRLGHIDYQLAVLGDDKELVIQSLKDLNFEANEAEIAAAQAAAKKAAEEADKKAAEAPATPAPEVK